MSSQDRKPNGQYKPKRYVGAQATITVELTDFEAMFLANRLWEAGEQYEQSGYQQAASECKLWSRRLHSERKTREECND